MNVFLKYGSLLCYGILILINPCFAQIVNETFDKNYEGSIGPYQVNLRLIDRFGSLSGNYNYAKYPNKWISFSGTKNDKDVFLNIDGNSDGEMESDDTVEVFKGLFINDSTITGLWEQGERKKLSFDLHEKRQKIIVPDINDTPNLKSYIGLNPWESKFFVNPFVQKKLKIILDSEYNSFLKFIETTGFSPQFDLHGNSISEDFSILHIGCRQQSMMLIDISTSQFYICWIKDDIEHIDIYHDNANPVPQHVYDYFLSALNEEWGHVYKFSKLGDKIVVK